MWSGMIWSRMANNDTHGNEVPFVQSDNNSAAYIRIQFCSYVSYRWYDVQSPCLNVCGQVLCAAVTHHSPAANVLSIQWYGVFCTHHSPKPHNLDTKWSWFVEWVWGVHSLLKIPPYLELNWGSLKHMERLCHKCHCNYPMPCGHPTQLWVCMQYDGGFPQKSGDWGISPFNKLRVIQYHVFKLRIKKKHWQHWDNWKNTSHTFYIEEEFCVNGHIIIVTIIWYVLCKARTGRWHTFLTISCIHVFNGVFLVQ